MTLLSHFRYARLGVEWTENNTNCIHHVVAFRFICSALTESVHLYLFVELIMQFCLFFRYAIPDNSYSVPANVGVDELNKLVSSQLSSGNTFHLTFLLTLMYIHRGP